jgi:hypothetical protein
MTTVARHLCIAACLGISVAALAQTSRFALSPEQQYQQDMRACEVMSPLQDQDACRTEARNALAEARKGQLEDPSHSSYRHNARERCDVFIGQDRADCLARIQSPTREQGSVEEGGVLRERITILPSRAP